MDSHTVSKDAGSRRRAWTFRKTDDANVADTDLDSAIVVNSLDQALTNARATVLRCEHQYFAALRMHLPDLAVAALDHGNEAQLHADRISERIVELGGNPAATIGPTVPCASAERRAGNSIGTVIGACLGEQRTAINCYRDLATSLAASDPATRDLIDGIVASEEKRAGVLAALLNRLPAA